MNEEFYGAGFDHVALLEDVVVLGLGELRVETHMLFVVALLWVLDNLIEPIALVKWV